MNESRVRDRIAELSREARVVLVRSGVTDLRDVTAKLERAGIAWRELPMPMGDPDSRAAFDRLREWTGSRTLPQCFVDGRFAGGPVELFEQLGLGGTPAGGQRLQRPAQVIGWAGLLPFLVGGLCVTLGIDRLLGYDTSLTLVGYGAIILSFLGATHWGMALAGPFRAFRARLLLGVSVLPALLAWFALLRHPDSPAGALLLLAFGFAALYAYERWVLGVRVLPGWYLAQRMLLSAVVVVVLLGGALRVWLIG